MANKYDYIVTERLYLTADGRVVGDKDSQKISLLAIPGQRLPRNQAIRLGLIKDQPVLVEPETKITLPDQVLYEDVPPFEPVRVELAGEPPTAVEVEDPPLEEPKQYTTINLHEVFDGIDKPKRGRPPNKRH